MGFPPYGGLARPDWVLCFSPLPWLRGCGRIAAAHNFLTVGDYLEYRYDRSVRRLVAGVLWLGALAILAGQLIAMAWILDVVAQAPKWFGCLLGGLVVTGYFSLGGLVSTAWVNVVQLAVKLAASSWRFRSQSKAREAGRE